MPTAVEVCNMALGVLDEVAITSLAEDSKAARLCDLHYDQVRQAELVKRRWYFAIVTASLVGTDTGIESEYSWEYTLPDPLLRLLPLTYDNDLEKLGGVPISWELRDGKLYSDQESPRGIRYIADKTDPNDWSPLFVDVVAAALAIKLAHPLTHKANMIQLAQNAYDRAVEEASIVNAFERDAALYDASWSLQRGDTRYWRP